MKIAGKRIPKGTILLFLSFTSIALCFLMILAAIRADHENSLSRNNLYSGHQRNFSLLHASGGEQWGDVIPELCSTYNDFSLYVSVEDPEIEMRGICVKGEVTTPPMLEGKYFDYATSWTDEPKVVIGKQYMKDVRRQGETMYYRYNDVDYEVMGIMGTDRESRINTMIMMDFKSALRLTEVNTEYVLDAKSKSVIPKIGTDMIDLFRRPAEVFIIVTEDVDQSLFARFLSADAIMDTMYVMILISFSLSTVLVTLIWLRFRRPLFFALRLCGYEKWAERLEISRQFYLTAGVSFMTGSLLMFMFTRLVTDIRMTAPDVLQALAMTVGLGTLILFLCYFLYHRRAKKGI